MIIYQIQNNVNKKSYIGQTKFDLKKRIEVHIKSSRKKQIPFYIHRAIKKYGIKNFSWKILVKCDNQRKLDETEIEMIEKYGTLAPKGYNMTLNASGGDIFSSHPNKDEIRKKIGEGTKRGQARAWLDPEKKKKWIENKTGKNNGMYGRKHTKESREKMSKNRKGKMTGDSNPMKNPKICKKQHLSDIRNIEYRRKHLNK